MKAIVRTITVLAAALLIAAVPVLAEEGGMGQQQQNFNNSECLLVAKNCPTDSIQERIQRIQGELNKGTSVYTNDELRHLNRELEEAQKFLELEMTQGGGDA